MSKIYIIKPLTGFENYFEILESSRRLSRHTTGEAPTMRQLLNEAIKTHTMRYPELECQHRTLQSKYFKALQQLEKNKKGKTNFFLKLLNRLK
jgi:hypothetical protein